MTHQIDVRLLSLAGIAPRCARETELFFQRQSHDPRYCYELFRRAILDQNQHAWELVYSQYRTLVAGWVERHPAFPVTGEEASYFVNRSFEKMWAAVSPAKFDRFPDLRSLLRYLQMCVHSVILDMARAAEQPALELVEELPGGRDSVGGSDAGAEALIQVHQQEIWEAISARLVNEKERRVIYGSFVLALKPREIYTQFRGTFSDVKEVYRVKENVLARLRRDSELKTFLGGNA